MGINGRLLMMSIYGKNNMYNIHTMREATAKWLLHRVAGKRYVPESTSVLHRRACTKFLRKVRKCSDSGTNSTFKLRWSLGCQKYPSVWKLLLILPFKYDSVHCTLCGVVQKQPVEVTVKWPMFPRKWLFGTNFVSDEMLLNVVFYKIQLCSSWLHLRCSSYLLCHFHPSSNAFHGYSSDGWNTVPR